MKWNDNGTAKCGPFEATVESIHGLDTLANICTVQGTLVHRFRKVTPAQARLGCERWLARQVKAMQIALKGK